MNEEDLMKFRNKCSSYVSLIHSKRNVVNLNVHNSIKHEQMKFRICYHLKSIGKEYITEARFRDNNFSSIADIICLDDCTIIEIMVTETEEQLEWKSRKFPPVFEVHAVKYWDDYFQGRSKIIRKGDILG